MNQDWVTRALGCHRDRADEVQDSRSFNLQLATFSEKHLEEAAFDLPGVCANDNLPAQQIEGFH